MIRRYEARLLHLATVVVGGTGLVYGYMRYLMKPVDEFSVLSHPWQPHALHLHVLTAPALLFLVGLVWKRHVGDRWQLRTIGRRRTGRAIAVLMLPMTASAYLLQVSSSPAARQLWIVVHVVTSILWLIGYGLHQLTPRPPSDGPTE